VDPAGAGARAGLREGDVIARIGGRSTLDPDFGERWRKYWGARPGSRMPLEVRRGEQTLALTAIVETLPRVDRQLVPDPQASTKARRIRAGILAGPQAP
jgi:S1-C subfamily serine protease